MVLATKWKLLWKNCFWSWKSISGLLDSIFSMNTAKERKGTEGQTRPLNGSHRLEAATIYATATNCKLI